MMLNVIAKREHLTITLPPSMFYIYIYIYNESILLSILLKLRHCF